MLKEIIKADEKVLEKEQLNDTTQDNEVNAEIQTLTAADESSRMLFDGLKKQI